MRKSVLILLTTIFVYAQARAADEFDGVKCRLDISSAMIGKQALNERVVVTERRHSHLGLKDLGAAEISDRLSLVFWSICGKEYAELVNTKKDLVRDVLPVPEHSLRSPLTLLGCQVDGHEVRAAMMAILNNSQAKKSAEFQEIVLPAKIAWKIDEHQERFVAFATEHLSCTLSSANPDVKQ